MIPLFLGLIGAFAQLKRDPKNFLAVLTLFLMTGLVLALYLNSTPNEPRERDYIYVGSYVAFTIWIGLAIPSLVSLILSPKLKVAAAVISLIVPAWMLHQNFDDHSRSGRTFQVDNARNVLASCETNAILFTGGDNDTFPLWYLQEVEGFRTDVRVVVLSYLNTDWYIGQLRKRYYHSPEFKFTLDKENYRQYGTNDVLYVQEQIKEGIDAAKYLELLKKDHPALTMMSGDEPLHILPSKTLVVKTAGNRVRKTASSSTDSIHEIELSVTGKFISKNALAILDLMVSNGMERPMYFNFTSKGQTGLNLEPYLVQEGHLYRLSPFRNPSPGIRMDIGKSYVDLIENSNYSNLQAKNVYFNYEDYLSRTINPVRQSFNALAYELIETGDTVRAAKVMDHALLFLYNDHLESSFPNLQAADILRMLNRKEAAVAVAKPLFKKTLNQIRWINDEGEDADPFELYLLRNTAQILLDCKDNEVEADLKTIPPDLLAQ
jgi:hypothetical protein